MGVCLTPNQFNSVMRRFCRLFKPSVDLFSKRHCEATGSHDFIHLFMSKVFRKGGGTLVALAAEARALRGGGLRDRISRVPSNTCVGSKSWQPQRRWSKRGIEEQERINRGRERSRSLAGDTSAQHSRQTREAAWQQRGDESSKEGTGTKGSKRKGTKERPDLWLYKNKTPLKRELHSDRTKKQDKIVRPRLSLWSK